MSAWHELLQITAPHQKCGLCFVRGHFPDVTEPILARAQRRNQSGTFGLGIVIPEDAEYVLEIATQGLINLRWPCTKFNFVRKDSLHGAIVFATYTICSFVKDGKVYQISRITPNHIQTASPITQKGEIPLGHSAKYFDLDVGGLVRFGCPSSAAEMPVRIGEDGHRLPFYDSYHVVSPAKPGDTTPVIACRSTCHEKRLEIRTWVNRDQQIFQLCKHELADFGIDHVPELVDEDLAPGLSETIALHSVQKKQKLGEDQPMTFVSVFALVDANGVIQTMKTPPIGSIDAMKYLGIEDRDCTSFSPYRL